ncbi:MAG: hypothetical protein N2746_05045 [Deltaproteobacteria bacterium]|nr:hypothetical protein [Deltaproteobacteria bacterium]
MNYKITKRGEFGSILYDCYKKGFSGAISVSTSNNTHTMYLRNGKPISIKEQKTTMPLGRVFVELGMIDNKAYDESLMEMAKTGERQGEILLRKGIITQEQMNQAINVQFYKKALKFFEINEGEVKISYSSEEIPTGSENIKNISTLKIIYHGIKSLNKEHIARLLPITNNTVITRKEELDLTLFSLPINAEETTVIENIKVKTPITTLTKLKILSDTELAQLIYFLFLIELIDISTLDISDTANTDENYIRLSGIYKPFEKSAEELIKQEQSDEKTAVAPISALEDIKWINELYKRHQTIDYFEFFQLDKNATDEQIKVAYQNMLRRLNAVKNDTTIDDELSIKIDQLTYFAEEVYNTLISEKSRKEYNSVITTYYGRVAVDEGQAEIEFTRGEIFLWKRNFVDAFEAFKKAIELGGQKPEYIASYGIALYLNPEESQRSRETLGKLYIKRAISQNPRCILAYIYQLLVTCIEGNSKDIEIHMIQIKNMFPNNERISKIIASLERFISKRPATGEIQLALKDERKENRTEQLLNIFFEKR